MPTRTMKERARAAMRALAALALAAALALPGAAFAGTSLGMRVYDSKQTPSTGDGTTALGIRVSGPVYEVGWDANGGAFPSGTPSTTQVKWGAATTAPGTPTREGYDFKGWSSASGGQPEQLPQQTAAAATWHAVWTPVEYKIAYDLDGGAASNPGTYTIETETFKLNNPSKAGWTFTGWSGTGLSGEANASVTIPKGSTGNRSYTAHWKLSEYQVTFMANGGTGDMAAQTFQHGVAQELSRNAFTRSGYEFLGWSEDKDAATAQYADGQAVSVTAATTLYAVWKINAHTVTFDANGGSGGAAATVEHGSAAAPPPDPKMAGYAFAGWRTGASGGAPYDFSAPVTGDLTLYAHWSLVVSCAVPVSAELRVDASGDVKGEVRHFSSSTVRPLRVSVAAVSELPGAASLVPAEADRAAARLTLEPQAGAGGRLELPLGGAPAAGEGLTVPEEGELPVAFGLALPEGARLAYADGAREVAELSYAIEPLSQAPEGHGSEGDPFYLKDEGSGQVYGADEVKAHAEDISENGQASPYFGMYAGYVADESKYVCRTVWGGAPYDVRVIGIRHDDKSDGTGKAGLTFQFANLLNARSKINTANSNSGGWGASELRASMNDGVIWDQVPSGLEAVISPVDKQYQSVYSSKGSTPDGLSSDKLFLASLCELRGPGVFLDWPGWVDNEGRQYDYWRGRGVSASEYAPLKKGLQSSPSKTIFWWERTASPWYATDFLMVRGSDGSPIYDYNTSLLCGVCPCFCL